MTAKKESSFIKRQKISEFFDSLSEKAVYICAPAGYGKTVAVRQWLDVCGYDSAVLSLCERDNDVLHFCEAFCVALLDCQPQNEILRKIVSHPSFSSAPDVFADRALSALSKGQKTRLVIDDLHFVGDERPLRLLASFLGRLPNDFQIVLVSRNELPTLFSELWLKGELACVTADDLRFSREDIIRLCRKRGQTIDAVKADGILKLTGGWAIAVNALLLSDTDPPEESVKHLDAFISANVWHTLDESTRDFIIKTSVISELTPLLCSALTNRPDCEETLDLLLSRNIFISKDSHGVYQYHRLFADFLQKLPEHQKIKPILLEKAGYWYLKQGNFYSAAECFTECENQRGIIKCFIFLAVIERNNFIVDRLLPILNHPIVRAAADKFPLIYSTMSWCAFAEGRPGDMAEYADRYYEKQFTVIRHDPRLAFYIVFMRLVDFRVSLSSLLRLIQKVPKALLSEKLSGAKPSIGIINQYMPLLHRGTRDFSECAVPDVESNVRELLSVMGGLFPEEATLLAECLMAGLYYEQGKLEMAHKRALVACSEIKSHFASETKFLAVSVLVYVLEALGMNEQAQLQIERIEDTIEQDGAYFLSYNSGAMRTRFAIAKGNVSAARLWLDKHAADIYNDIDFYHFYGHLTTGRAYITIGDYDSAVILLKKALTIAESYNRPMDVIEIRILLAIAYWKKRGIFQEDAVRHLEVAVCVAYQYGYIQAFIDEDAELAGMLLRLQRRAEQHGVESIAPTSFIKKLHLKALGSANSGLASGQAEAAPAFTERQKEVMRLMCEGKSYREIMGALGITRPTLRSHLSAIYNKLGVTEGRDAIKKIELMDIL